MRAVELAVFPIMDREKLQVIVLVPSPYGRLLEGQVCGFDKLALSGNQLRQNGLSGSWQVRAAAVRPELLSRRAVRITTNAKKSSAEPVGSTLPELKIQCGY
jgi:hypothetical protein